MDSTRRMRVIAVALALPALLTSGLGAARADAAVLLRYRYPVGQHFTYLSVGNVPPVPGVTLRNMGDAPQPLVAERLTIPMLVKYQYPDGSYSLKFGPSGGKIRIDGFPSTPNANIYQIERVGSRDQLRILTTYGPTSSLKSEPRIAWLFLAFPETPVAIGSAWASTQRVAFQPYGTFMETDTYTLIGFGTVGGRRIALLGTAGIAPIHLPRSTVLDATVTLDGSLSSRGTARVFVDTGALLDQRTTASIHVTVDTGAGASRTVQASETIATTLLP